MNRRKWATQMAYLEMISDSGNEDENSQNNIDIPDPIMVDEDITPDKYEQDDIELV